VGPKAGLDVCEKSRPPPGFDSRTVQPVTSRYTDPSYPTHETEGMSLELSCKIYGTKTFNSGSEINP
jgi:hypothetical protein